MEAKGSTTTKFGRKSWWKGKKNKKLSLLQTCAKKGESGVIISIPTQTTPYHRRKSLKITAHLYCLTPSKWVMIPVNTTIDRSSATWNLENPLKTRDDRMNPWNIMKLLLEYTNIEKQKHNKKSVETQWKQLTYWRKHLRNKVENKSLHLFI